MANNVDNGQCIKPVETRRRTDKFFILVFPLGFLASLGIGIFEIFHEGISHDNIWFICKWNSLYFLVYGVVAVIIIFIFVVILNALKENWLGFLVLIFYAGTVFAIVACILSLIFFNLNAEWLCIIVLFLVILSNGLRNNAASLLYTVQSGVASLGPMTKKPVRAIANSFAASIISFVMVIFLLIMVSTYAVILLRINIGILILHYDYSYEERIMSKGCFLWFFIFTCGFTSMCLFNFIWNFGFMVMGDYFVRYYSNERVSKTDIFRGIARIWRHHLGTIGFLSLPILPLVCAFIMVFKKNINHGHQNNKQPGQRSSSTLLDNLINFISKISLIMNIPDYALIQTSFHGSDAMKSIRQMVDLYFNNPSLFLTLNVVLLKIIDLSMIITWVVGHFSNYHILKYGFEHNIYHRLPRDIMDIANFTFYFYVNIYFIYSIIGLCMRPAMCTFTIYKMIRDQHQSRTPGEQIELIAH